MTVGEIDLNAYVEPPPLAVSRATHWPPLGAVTPWLTASPATVDHIDSEPLSKSSWKTTPADGVVTCAMLLSTDECAAASRDPDGVAVLRARRHRQVAIGSVAPSTDASRLPPR